MIERKKLTNKQKLIIIQHLRIAGLDLRLLKHTGYKRTRRTRNTLF